MTGGPAPPVSRWQPARVLAVRAETARARTLRLALPAPSRHLAGQHYLVRLTAPDGYTATRSYSVASAPDGGAQIELTVERLDRGEVSPFLHDVVEPGDELLVRGPVGGWFTWAGESPALLVGGGSGVVPLMAMLRLARLHGREELLRVLVSARSPDELYYADELPGPHTSLVFTRAAPPGATRQPGRLGAADLAGVVRGGEQVYICGSPGFCDAATTILLGLAVPAQRIRVERFGPSG